MAAFVYIHIQKGKARGVCCRLTTKTVQSTALAFEGVDNVHGSDSLPLGVLGVGDGVTDHVLEEHLQDTTGFFVDETRDTFHASTTGKTTDGRLGDTLDVITKNLAMPLGASLSETLSSLATSCHLGCVSLSDAKIAIAIGGDRIGGEVGGWGRKGLGLVAAVTNSLRPRTATRVGFRLEEEKSKKWKEVRE